jgi:hypothetical protein
LPPTHSLYRFTPHGSDAARHVGGQREVFRAFFGLTVDVIGVGYFQDRTRADGTLDRERDMKINPGHAL